MTSHSLVLASASPRRFELLRGLGLDFTVEPSHAEEPPPTAHELAEAAFYVERLARLKASACPAAGVIIAADTIVELDGDILGKPRSTEEAEAMLQRLRGRTHRVFTGICVRQGERHRTAHETTFVTFGHFSDLFVKLYVETGEPMDKAGAYAAQGRGALLVERIEGDYWNVVGLPLNRLARLLAEFDVRVELAWGHAARENAA